ncbi:MAG: extracellular catalytic domain type 2 short-chain-length polyhydroxyalkanoate depolymerase [Methyloceanibacter sp.]|uniref:extracellular catalytic domain type 2 short-chain-length polyhydroxyalkanoate depolymerase n=1 Tax=Methyloceanibacter sp. TaxID=1965321 RepID=UPI003D6D47EF
MASALLAACLVAGLTVKAGEVRAAELLPRLGTALDATSVSGLSSGAYMAGQIELAHAKNIVGAGIVAGGPFACAETAASRVFPFWPTAVGQNAAQALYQCMRTTLGPPDPERLVDRAKELADGGVIDPLDALAAHNVYLYSGDDDQTVTRPVVQAAKRFYDVAGVPAGNVTLVEGQGGHAFITEEGGAACGLSEEPFVSDCDYDQAKAILAWIYGPLESPSAEPQGEFLVFDQTAFAGPGDGIADEGVVYVPPDCAETPGCRVHVALHGCSQGREKVGEAFVQGAGFAEIADSNRLVVLFPQAEPGPYNPEGCWDWWGYTGLDYLGKDAPQIKAIWSMVEHLAKAHE